MDCRSLITKGRFVERNGLFLEWNAVGFPTTDIVRHRKLKFRSRPKRRANRINAWSIALKLPTV